MGCTNETSAAAAAALKVAVADAALQAIDAETIVRLFVDAVTVAASRQRASKASVEWRCGRRAIRVVPRGNPRRSSTFH